MSTRFLRLATLAAALALGCAHAGGSSKMAAPPAAKRLPDSARERKAALEEVDPVVGAETVEQRFAAERDRELRARDKAARADAQRRVEVVNDKGQPSPSPQPGP